MSVTLLEQPPLTVPRDLGPYRREDYAALPEEPRCELIHGRFYLSPSPILRHQFLVTHVWQVLKAAADREGGLAVVAPMDVHLADHTVVQPDVLYVSPERREIAQTWIEGAPDLLVEVLSPGTARVDRLQKLNLYAASGVAEYWIVDPANRTVEFFVHDGDRFGVHTPKGRLWTSPAVRGVQLDIEALWTAVEREFGPQKAAD